MPQPDAKRSIAKALRSSLAALKYLDSLSHPYPRELLELARFRESSGLPLLPSPRLVESCSEEQASSRVDEPTGE